MKKENASTIFERRIGHDLRTIQRQGRRRPRSGLVELAATAFWLLWALRDLAKTDNEKLPGWWRSGKLTPGAVRRMAAGLLMGFG